LIYIADKQNTVSGKMSMRCVESGAVNGRDASPVNHRRRRQWRRWWHQWWRWRSRAWRK